jgi:hypothetical protein
MKKLKQSTKMKVITGEVSFYTTVKQIRGDFGTSMYFTTAVNAALDALENARTNANLAPIGICGNWIGYPIQLDIVQC